jgi:integrase
VARPRKPKIALPPYIQAVRVRGRDYFYFQHARGTARAAGHVRIPGHPFDSEGTPDPQWWEAYRQAAGQSEPRPPTGTFSLLIDAYQESLEWHGLSPRTRTEWARHLRTVREAWGNLQVNGVEPKHVLALRDTRAKTPANANNLIRALSSVLGWAVPRGWRLDNPCLAIPKLKIGEGYAPWPWDAIEYFAQHARSHLWHAAALALFSGQRLSDVLKVKWSDISQGLISVRQRKTGKPLWIPIHRRLAAILEQLPRTSVYALTPTKGRPWTLDGFKASWSAELNRDVMQELRSKRLVFHGLRKSAVVMLLEAGATDAEVAAITGQSREMVEHYSRQVNQRKLAASAILKWEAADHSTVGNS